MTSVLNDPAPAGRTRSGSARPRPASNGSKSTWRGVRAAPTRHVRVGSRPPAFRRSATGGAPCSAVRASALPAPRRDPRRGSATDDAFGYRILYLAPELVPGHGRRRAAVRPGSRAAADAGHGARRSCLANIDEPISDLDRRARGGRRRTLSIADRRARRTGEHRPSGRSNGSATTWRDTRPSRRRRQDLGAGRGIDRFTIARQFRRAFGTSPDRYRTMRRLARARAAIEKAPFARRRRLRASPTRAT